MRCSNKRGGAGCFGLERGAITNFHYYRALTRGLEGLQGLTCSGTCEDGGLVAADKVAMEGERGGGACNLLNAGAHIQICATKGLPTLSTRK